MSEASGGRATNVSSQPLSLDSGYGDGMPEGMSAYLFVDTFAVEKLSAEPECRVGRRNATIHGYETYVIEQWACERQVNTVVASYTGNSQHVVEVQVLYVPANLEKWSQSTFAHFEELVRMHILPKQTPLGNMLVTSLSSLPSNLSLVPMPPRFAEGRLWFIVNKNLRRLNVVGRVATTADVPSDSVMANFRRAYNTASVVSPGYAVKELVTLMQISLVYFGLLNPEYVDGFLCDFTLKALGSWWSSFGKQRYRVTPPRPTDKLYMRTTCAALVGAVTGSRQRLSALGLKPPKDPFDAENFVECIKRFQKLEKLTRTKRLDDKTYFKLVHETTKISSLGGTKVLTVMKSTMKEGFSGKATGGVDDWETLDLDILTANCRGNRAQYLWQGKGSPCVPHLIPQFPIEKVGPSTGIPHFSLTQEGLDESSHRGLGGHHHHHYHHHYIHGPRRQHHSQTDIENPSEDKLVDIQEEHKGSEDSTGSLQSSALREKNSRLSDEAPLGTLDASGNEPRSSLVNQFIKKQQQKQPQHGSQQGSQAQSTQSQQHQNLHQHQRQAEALGEPFDDTRTHHRDFSTSSEHWFATRSPPKQTNAPGSLQSPTVNDDPRPQDSSSPSKKSRSHENNAFSRLESPAILLTKDDYYVYDQQPVTPVLRRTASLGEIENIVFPWDSLCALPKIVMLYHEVRDLKQQLIMRMTEERQVDAVLSKDIIENDRLLSIAQRNNVLIKYQVNASSKKEDAVRRRVRELEAFMARLDYELGTLKMKLKDVEQSVMIFSARVDTMETKWSQSKEVREKPWYTRWLWFT